MRNTVIIGTFVVLFLAAGLARAGEIVVVAHPGLPSDSLTQQEVKKIFLGEKAFVGDTKLHPVGYVRDDAMSDAFLKAALGMTAESFESYWLKEVFRSGRVPPRKVGTPDEVIKAVAGEPGAIGYVPAEAVGGAGMVKRVFSVQVP